VPDAHSAVIRAPQQRLVDTMLDFDRYPEWQSGVLECSVLERDEDGRGSLVDICVDAKVRKIRYSARYWYDLDAGRLGFDLVEGDLRRCTGRYRFEPVDPAATRVSVDIVAEPAFFVPGPFKRLLREQAVRNAVRDLARRVGG
jgi:ribosome-associated toxin RatA of RatAB toxin-antitoxin module